MTGGNFGGNAPKRSQSDFGIAIAPKFGGKKKQKNALLAVDEDENEGTEDGEGFVGVAANDSDRKGLAESSHSIQIPENDSDN